MKSIAFALVLVATVVAAEDAPQDVIVPVDCRADTDCQAFDLDAKCIEGMCDCSGDDRTRYCTAKSTDEAPFVRITLSYVFDLSCLDLDDLTRALIHTKVEETIDAFIYGYDLVCGSVIVVFSVDTDVTKVDQVLQVTTEQMQVVQQQVPVLQTAVMSTDFVYGNDTKQCTLDNAVSTIFLEDKICFPTCETGYTRVLVSGFNESSAYTCSSTGSNDDDLSATAVAAIVIAVVLFCGIIVAIIYYVTGKPNDAVPTQNEPYNHEDKPTEEVEGQQKPEDITV